MKKFAANIARIVVKAGENFLELANKNPVMARVTVMTLLTSVALFTPEQLASIEKYIDAALPFVLILMGAELRSQVIPANGSTGAAPKPAPVKVPTKAAAGASGAF